MFGLQRGAFPLFRVAGITVSMHWTWLLMAYVIVKVLPNKYDQPAWKLIEFLAVFAIVLLHEFGHALACRSVGGEADAIILWPLGGVAFVAPPPRPLAVLWSIAAGPLVNVVLVPVTFGLFVATLVWAGDMEESDLSLFFFSIALMNLMQLIFNLLPIYPLDGGQIVRALLWLFSDKETSLLAASILGLMGSAGLVVVVSLAFAVVPALGPLCLWFGIIGVFLVFHSWVGLNQARLLLEMKRAPRDPEHACPSCGHPPPRGEFWTCGHCGARFDLFHERGFCPECEEYFDAIYCPECHQPAGIADWAYVNQSREDAKT